MNTYSMSQIETLTGVKSATLRVWERRYSFLKPMRTETNIRYYSDAEIRKILNISILINNGYRVSKIDKMSEDEVHSLVLKLNSMSSAKFDDDLNRLVLAMIEFDEISFSIIFQRHITRNGLMSTILNLIYPFLHHVGVLWSTNKTIPAHEHFMSNLIRRKIIAATDMVGESKENAPVIIIFLPENEDHEIGLLLANYIARDLGFKVLYLGQNVPIENIIEVNENIGINVLLTMFVTPITKEYHSYFKESFEKIGIPLLISGNYDISNSPSNFEYIGDPNSLIERLKLIYERTTN